MNLQRNTWPDASTSHNVGVMLDRLTSSDRGQREQIENNALHRYQQDVAAWWKGHAAEDRQRDAEFARKSQEREAEYARQIQQLQAELDKSRQQLGQLELKLSDDSLTAQQYRTIGQRATTDAVIRGLLGIAGGLLVAYLLVEWRP